MTVVHAQSNGHHESPDAVALALKTLAAHRSDALLSLRKDEQLRKDVLSLVPELITELETPVETSQRLLYNVSESRHGDIGRSAGMISQRSPSF